MLRTGMVGLHVVIPVAVILTASYFVLLANKKLDKKSKRLKTFGRAIAGLLWFAAALVFISGAYSLLTGKCSMKDKKYKMMKKGMKYHSEMKGGMHGEMKKR